MKNRILLSLALLLAGCATFDGKEVKLRQEHLTQQKELIAQIPPLVTKWEWWKYTTDDIARREFMEEVYQMSDQRQKDTWNLLDDQRKFAIVEEYLFLEARRNNELDGIKEREQKRKEILQKSKALDEVFCDSLGQLNQERAEAQRMSQIMAASILANSGNAFAQPQQPTYEPPQKNYPSHSTTTKIGNTYYHNNY